MIYKNYMNISELADVQPDRSVIPSHTLTFCEDAVYVAEAIEEDYNRIFQEIGVNELAFYESTGCEIVYEAEEKQGLIQKVVQFFKDLWAKIKAGFEAILLKFQSLSKEVRNQIPNITAQQVKSCNLTNFGKTHDFKIEGEGGTYLLNAKSLLDEIEEEFNKAIRTSSKNEDSKQKGRDIKDKLEKQICKKISGFDVSNVSEMTKKIHEYLLGSEIDATKDWVASNIGMLISIVKQGNSKNVIKKNYQLFKAVIDNCIARLKTREDEMIGYIDSIVAVLKEMVKAAHAANNVVMDVAKRRYSEYRNILLRVAVCLHKKNTSDVPEDKVNPGTALATTREASDISNQVELIESLFEW